MRRVLITVLALGVLVASTSGTHAQQIDEPYRVLPIAEPTHPLVLREWKLMPQKMLIDAAIIAACREEPGRCSQAAKTLVELIDRVKREKTFYERTRLLNEEIVRLIKYSTDLDQWGTDQEKKKGAPIEVWSSPLDALRTGKGDCEESANLQFFVLWQIGVRLQQMRFVLLQEDEGNEMHIMLAARGSEKGDRWKVFDIERIKYASEYRLVYSLPPHNFTVPAAVATAEPAR